MDDVPHIGSSAKSTSHTGSSPAPALPAFTDRLRVAVYSLVLFALANVILYFGKPILQPLFVAVFIAYLLLPVHHWLEQRGLHYSLAYVLIVVVIIAGLFGVGILVFDNLNQMVDRLPDYETRLTRVVYDFLKSLPFELDLQEGTTLGEMLFGEDAGNAKQVREAIQHALGTFANFFSGLAITFIYLLFLMAERFSIARRVALAFGEAQSSKILAVAQTINTSISEYLAVKTSMGFLAGMLSIIVLASFRVDFAVMWGILVFLLNYIPYLGSLVAVILPILLSFVQLESFWSAIIVAVLLIAIQQVTGTYLEPRIAGRRLGVSPLLILLSLSFWGLLWGIVGMILAVPLLVVVKTILDNIEATKPIGTLMSNQ